MARTFAWAEDVTHTGAGFGYPGQYVYTQFGTGFPAGNPASTGGNPVKVYNSGADYISGAGHSQVVFAGADVSGGQTVHSTGGGFEHRIWCDAGYVYYGRNANKPGINVGKTFEGGGVEWAGAALCGWLNWATVPGAPAMLEATPQAGGKILIRFSGAGDDGGEPVQQWQIELATNSAFSAGNQYVNSSGTTTFQGVPGTKYWIRARGRNDVGWSAFSGALTATAKSGGKVSVAGTWRTAVWKVSVAGVHRDAIVRASVGGTWRDAI